jgi:hypothetical protein
MYEWKSRQRLQWDNNINDVQMFLDNDEKQKSILSRDHRLYWESKIRVCSCDEDEDRNEM